MGRLAGVCIRAVLTAWLLVRVYHGSRAALVVALGLSFFAIEAHALVIYLERRHK